MAAAAAEEEFHGLVLPAGAEKKVLYHSAYRAIATYATSVSELDRELQAMLLERSAKVSQDGRRNLCGKCVRSPSMRNDTPGHARS